jgi:hypothetical protein
MTFGSFRFLVGKVGSHHLTILTLSGPSAVEPNYSGSSTPSEESSGEKILPPRFTKPAVGGAITALFGDMTFGSFTGSDLDSDSESCKNFNFLSDDNSTSSREVLADLYDGVTDFEADESFMTTYHRIYVIIGAGHDADEESEAFDDLGNPYIDPVDLMHGKGNKYIRSTPREKVQLPQEAWDRAQRAMDGTEPVTKAATAQALQAYQYKLARAGRELEKQRAILDEIKLQLLHQVSAGQFKSTLEDFGRYSI